MAYGPRSGVAIAHDAGGSTATHHGNTMPSLNRRRRHSGRAGRTVMTRRRLRCPSRSWWFPTVGPANDRIVSWLGPARSLSFVLLIFAVIFFWLSHSVEGGFDGWAGAPVDTGIVVVGWTCGRRKDGSRLRHQALAVITFCVLFAAMSFAGVRIFPAAGHAHPGPLRGLVYLVAAVVAVYSFTTVTHWRRRDTAPSLVEQDTRLPT